MCTLLKHCQVSNIYTCSKVFVSYYIRDLQIFCPFGVQNFKMRQNLSNVRVRPAIIDHAPTPERQLSGLS